MFQTIFIGRKDEKRVGEKKGGRGEGGGVRDEEEGRTMRRRRKMTIL